MACDHSAKIAAIAPVAGLRAGVPKEVSAGVWQPDPKTCQPRNPVPVRTFHGTADGTNPFAGNDDPRWGYSVPIALRRWARIDHCTKGPATSKITATVNLVLYSKCRAGVTVGLYREEGANHTWPGDASTPVGVDRSINATALIWRFFKGQSLANRRAIPRG
jgi:polyhydroxybutyrate depolymerase